MSGALFAIRERMHVKICINIYLFAVYFIKGYVLQNGV